MIQRVLFPRSLSLNALPLCAAFAIFTSQTVAAPQFQDARAMAMGGVGVAAARPAAASFYNPALLSTSQAEKSDGFGMLLPSLSVMANDEHELIDTVDDFETDFLDPFEASIDNLEATILAAGNVNAALDQFERDTERLHDELTRINNDQAIIDAGLGLSFSIPGQSLGVGVFADSAARVGAALQYRDADTLQTTIDQARQAVIDNDPSLITYSDGDLTSSVRAIGVAKSEVGLSLSHNFDLGTHQVALGVSPKIVNYRVYDLSYDVDIFDDLDEEKLKDSEESETVFNFDIGLAGYLDQDQRWLAGLAIKDVIPQSLTTKDSQIEGGALIVSGVEIDLNPLATAAISYAGDSYIVAADVQLTRTKATFTEDDEQYIGIGAEYDLFESAQFRLGTRYNLAGSSDPVFTTGLGLTVLGASLELAALSSADANNLGLSFQIGSTF